MSRRGWYWLALGVLLALLAVYAHRRDLYGVYQQYVQSEEYVRSLDARRQTLENEAATLGKRVRHLSNDPIEMEAAVRDEKQLVREGETIYRIELPEETNNRKD